MTTPLPRVAITRSHLPGAALDRLRQHAEVVVWRDDENTPVQGDDLIELAKGCSAVIAPFAELSRDVIEALPELRIIALPSAGFDAVDVEAAADHSVIVTNAPNALNETTADTAFALILMTRRLLILASDELRAGGWQQTRLDEHLGLDVHGGTLGLIGFGQIGQAVAQRATGFGMRVQHALSRKPSSELSEQVELDALLASSDVVSLHIGLSSETRGLIGRRELDRMHPTATLVNTARGPIVDTAEVLEALDRGAIHSFGTDVFDHEPLRDPSHPLLQHPRVTALPHVGSATEAARARVAELAVENVLAVLAGGNALTPVPTR